MAALIRIEALPGDGRYAVSFQRADGSEQTAVMHLTGGELRVAEASLPTGLVRASEAFDAIAAAISSFDEARRHAPAAPYLRDIDGGWDVSLGNVILGQSGKPTCTAHGEMNLGENDEYLCPECYARALLVT